MVTMSQGGFGEHGLHGGEGLAASLFCHCASPLCYRVAAGGKFCQALFLKLLQGFDVFFAYPAAAGKGECAHIIYLHKKG